MVDIEIDLEVETSPRFHTFSLSLPNDELSLTTLRLISSSIVAESR